ncbi:hypothetical protein IFVP203_C2190236 [Vibrio parahaemolyticus]
MTWLILCIYKKATRKSKTPNADVVFMITKRELGYTGSLFTLEQQHETCKQGTERDLLSLYLRRQPCVRFRDHRRRVVQPDWVGAVDGIGRLQSRYSHAPSA